MRLATPARPSSPVLVLMPWPKSLYDARLASPLQPHSLGNRAGQVGLRWLPASLWGLRGPFSSHLPCSLLVLMALSLRTLSGLLFPTHPPAHQPLRMAYGASARPDSWQPLPSLKQHGQGLGFLGIWFSKMPECTRFFPLAPHLLAQVVAMLGRVSRCLSCATPGSSVGGNPSTCLPTLTKPPEPGAA